MVHELSKYIYLSIKMTLFSTYNLLPDDNDDKDDENTDNSACDNTLLVHSGVNYCQKIRLTIFFSVPEARSIATSARCRVFLEFSICSLCILRLLRMSAP